tara:strand:+ start:61 stop:699 length:639 start_codon:yes stop_codon:yes gene_type:complete
MTMKRISSLTSILPKVRNSKTSIEPIGSGVTIELSGTQKDQAVARLLKVGQPTTIDASLLSLVESITKYKVNVNELNRYPANGGFVTILKGFDIEADTVEDVDKCILAVTQAQLPMSYPMLRERLAVLATLVIKPSGEGEEDIDVRMKSLAQKLMEFPADIASYAITQVERTQKFWPSFAEFYTHIGWRLTHREYLLRDLNKKRIDLLRVCS